MEEKEVLINETNNHSLKKDKKPTKIILLIILCVILLGLEGLAYYYYFTNKPEKESGPVIDKPKEKITYTDYEEEKEFDYASSCDEQSTEEALQVISKNGKLGVINSDKYIILDLEYDNIYFDDFCSKTIIAGKNGLYGVFDFNGKQILPVEYELYSQTILGEFFVTLNYSNGYAAIIKNGKLGVADKTGQLVITYKYNVGQFSSEESMYNDEDSKANVKGYVDEYDDEYDENGEPLNPKKGLIINFQDMLMLFTVDKIKDNPYFVIRDNAKFGVVDVNGNTIIPFDYDMVQYDYFLNAYFAYKNNKMYTFDEKGTSLKEWGTTVFFPTYEMDGIEYKKNDNVVYQYEGGYCTIKKGFSYNCFQVSDEEDND